MFINVSIQTPDDRDPCCEVCPQFWTRFGRYCYRLFSILRTWDAAEDHCQTFFNPSGIAHLASVHSEQENHYLFELQRTQLLRLSNDVRYIQTWIGLKDDNWCDGSRTHFRYKWSGAPTAHPCTFMQELVDGTNGWNKAASNVNYGRSYICQLPVNEGN